MNDFGQLKRCENEQDFETCVPFDADLRSKPTSQPEPTQTADLHRSNVLSAIKDFHRKRTADNKHKTRKREKRP